jgi:hypothetical protein
MAILLNVRQRLSSVWLLILTLAYLCSAIISGLPHVHEHGNAVFFPAHVPVTAPATGVAMTTGDSDPCDDDHCIICQAQESLAACASFALPVIALPSPPSTPVLTPATLQVRSITVLTSSRAPPRYFC